MARYGNEHLRPFEVLVLVGASQNPTAHWSGKLDESSQNDLNVSDLLGQAGFFDLYRIKFEIR